VNTQHLVKKTLVSLMALRQTIRQKAILRLVLSVLVLCLAGANNASALKRVGSFDPSSPGKIGPVGPEIDNGVHAAQDFSVSSPSPTSVGLRWFNKGAPQTRISRSVNGGPWETVQTYGELPVNAYASFLDNGATANAENCYVIVVTDGLNSWSALSTPQRCYFTRDGRDLPVHRLQFRLRVPNISGAGTDDDVEVRLQSPAWLVPSVTNWRPAGNSTWIDSTADDFERGSNRTYDLMLTNISQVSDITMITIAKDTGTDHLCIAEIELLIDGQPAHRQTFGDTAATCVWVTAGNPLSVTFNDLRTSSLWNMLSLPTFTGIDGAGLRSVIEATFAHELHGSKGELRNGGTTTSQRVSENRLHVTVPLVVHDVWKGPIYLGDVNSTVYFDLVLTPAVDNQGNPVTAISIENEDADSFDLLAVFFPVFVAPVLYGVSTTIEDRVASFGPIILDSSPLSGTHVCFTPDAGIGLCLDSSPRRVKRTPIASSLQ
jgi:hypothetical protein